MENIKTYCGLINKLNTNQVFVFGSNTEGRHGRGTAKIALNKYGAKYGQGHGLQGMSYGLVTKNLTNGYYDRSNEIIYNKSGPRSISIDQLIKNIMKLYEFANSMNNKEFLVAFTANGTNLNGYSNTEMAKMFYDAGTIPSNVVFEDKFFELIKSNCNYSK